MQISAFIGVAPFENDVLQGREETIYYSVTLSKQKKCLTNGSLGEPVLWKSALSTTSSPETWLQLQMRLVCLPGRLQPTNPLYQHSLFFFLQLSERKHTATKYSLYALNC